MDLHKKFEFRTIRPEEADEAAIVERICFPPHEACTPERMKRRIGEAADFFLVAIDRENGMIAGFLNGIATDEDDFRDEFFTDISLHNPDGKNIMLMGLTVLPQYRLLGLASELIRTYYRREKDRNREKLVLTCLDEKVAMYKKLGFKDKGESASVWGGEKWHEMEIYLNIA